MVCVHIYNLFFIYFPCKLLRIAKRKQNWNIFNNHRLKFVCFLIMRVRKNHWGKKSFLDLRTFPAFLCNFLLIIQKCCTVCSLPWQEATSKAGSQLILTSSSEHIFFTCFLNNPFHVKGCFSHGGSTTNVKCMQVYCGKVFKTLW